MLIDQNDNLLRRVEARVLTPLCAVPDFELLLHLSDLSE